MALYKYRIIIIIIIIINEQLSAIESRILFKIHSPWKFHSYNSDNN